MRLSILLRGLLLGMEWHRPMEDGPPAYYVLLILESPSNCM